MSANPRSPESGDVPENTPDWVQEQIEAAQRRTREYPDHFESPPVMRRYDKALVWLASVWNATRTANGALSARVESLTAELSSARERADRAEQENGRLRTEVTLAKLAERMACAGIAARIGAEAGLPTQRAIASRIATEIDNRSTDDLNALSTPTPTPDHA